MRIILNYGLSALGLFVGVLVCLRMGWWAGRRRWSAEGDSGQSGLGAVEGALFGLMGLLIAFTFTGAANRFGDRRDLIRQQVNAISTAWLRMDLLPEPHRSEMRGLLADYLDTYLKLGKLGDQPQALAETRSLVKASEARIWERAMVAVRSDPSLPLTMFLLPSLNEVFDVGETRWLATRQHPPSAVFFMLGLLVLISSLLAGFGMGKAKHQSLLHIVGFALIMALAIYIILDLEYPRLGMIRVDGFDLFLQELRDSM